MKRAFLKTSWKSVEGAVLDRIDWYRDGVMFDRSQYPSGTHESAWYTVDGPATYAVEVFSLNADGLPGEASRVEIFVPAAPDDPVPPPPPTPAPLIPGPTLEPLTIEWVDG